MASSNRHSTRTSQSFQHKLAFWGTVSQKLYFLSSKAKASDKMEFVPLGCLWRGGVGLDPPKISLHSPSALKFSKTSMHCTFVVWPSMH